MGPTLGAHLWNADAASLRRRAKEVEELGYVSVTVGDHLGYFSPLTACAILAEATSGVRLGPLVLNNDLRHPVVLAHEAVALADLAEGRFELGIGAGYARREYERAGIPFAPRAERVARLAESVEILRRLFTGETVDFDGNHYRVRDQSLPLVAEHAVPIIVGGNSDAVHEIAGRHADVIGLAGSPRSRLSGTSDYARSALARQLAQLDGRVRRHVLTQWHAVTGDRRGAAEEAARVMEVSPEVVLDSPYVLVGTPEEIAGQLAEDHVRFGIERWTIFADRPGHQPAEALAPVLALLASG